MTIQQSQLKTLTPLIDELLPGKSQQVELSLCALISGGHALIEDAPGMGKTTLAYFMGKILNLKLSRIQFTNDLLPADILGSNVFHPTEGKFVFRRGPLFGELILADELNRAPAKTQSALLQAMEEKFISVEGEHYPLSPLFSVFATQNPRGMSGTFALPESQLDRFLMKFSMGHPPREAELRLIQATSRRDAITELVAPFKPEDLVGWRKASERVLVSPEIAGYIMRLLENSRQRSGQRGLSSRAGIDLVRASKAWAFINARDFVLPDDVKFLFPFVAAHRLPLQELGVRAEQELAREILKDVSVL